MNRIWLGNRIRDARERRHLTQEKLSEIVDISPTHMSVLERGVKGMKLSTFIKIAKMHWMFQRMSSFRMS